ncbi:MAG: dUTP diphosphatase [Chloroflexi bacterium]|nr:dUTP diphosphatase [Chloroflexota bacterium]
MQRLGVNLIHAAAKAPQKMTAGSAGLDLYAAENAEIPPTRCYPDGRAEVGRAVVPTGIVIELPQGTVGRVASRSGMSVRSNVEVGAGWIDNDYRGEVMVELKNLSSQPYRVNAGDRIAQLAVLPVVDVDVQVAPRLEQTSRGSGGFGSTGS